MMFAVIATLFLAGASALPTTQGPFLAVIVPNVTTGIVPPTAILGKTMMNNTGLMYHRVEFQFLDFQMNQTQPFTDTLIQPIEVYTNVTYGPHPTGQTTEFSTTAPETIEGYPQIFAGTYNGGKNNLINIDRTWTADMCGTNFNGGYMDVWVRPLTGSTPGLFQEGFYTCFFTLPPYATTFFGKDTSSWSGTMQCNSGNVNNYSYRLWFQVRTYSIQSGECHFGQFINL